ncbi:MAG TPA: nuclear transport factor 2 family protein [Conexibacter sp.]|jgi:hypothetical protein
MTETKQSNEEDVAILEQLNLDFNHFDQTNDVERFKQILAEDFIMQLPGVTRNRAEFLDFIAKPRPFKDLAVREARVRILSDVALIHATSTFTVLATGANEESLYTDVYQKRDGIWLCVAATAIVPQL